MTSFPLISAMTLICCPTGRPSESLGWGRANRYSAVLCDRAIFSVRVNERHSTGSRTLRGVAAGISIPEEGVGVKAWRGRWRGEQWGHAYLG